MTVPMLTRDQAGAAAKAAVAERDAIQANLLELDSSFGKQLLAGAVTGERPVNPDSSVCVKPKDPWSASTMVNVMVRRFR